MVLLVTRTVVSPMLDTSKIGIGGRVCKQHKVRRNALDEIAVKSNFTPMAADNEPRKLTPAAERALAEAAERRAAQDAGKPTPKEVKGRQGLDPVRYGDWENKGIASDF